MKPVRVGVCYGAGGEVNGEESGEGGWAGNWNAEPGNWNTEDSEEPQR
jgi:hypothetical protein